MGAGNARGRRRALERGGDWDGRCRFPEPTAGVAPGVGCTGGLGRPIPLLALHPIADGELLPQFLGSGTGAGSFRVAGFERIIAKPTDILRGCEEWVAGDELVVARPDGGASVIRTGTHMGERISRHAS